MKIFKFQASATACTWVRGEELAFVTVPNNTRFSVSLLGKSDDLAYDIITVTTDADKSGEAATILANHMHNKNMNGIVDVVAIDHVTGTSNIQAA
jgi:hypothetical protein